MRFLIQLLASVVILAVAVGISYHIVTSKPRLPKREERKAAVSVKSFEVRLKPYVYTVETTGTVVLKRERRITSELSAKVLYVSPKLVPGQMVRRGEVLVRLDPKDYELRVRDARARVEDLKRRILELEELAARQTEEWQEVYPGKEPPPLVKKEPELSSLRAQLEAALFALNKAEEDLKKAVIKAPCEARVLRVEVSEGEFVPVGRVLSVLYCTEDVEVYIPVADHFLPYIRVPGLNIPLRRKGSSVEVTWDAGRPYSYEGYIVRGGAQVEDRTKLVPLYAKVFPRKGAPELLPGVFVKVRIKGKTFRKAAVIPKSALFRELGKSFVWVISENETLEKRFVEVIYEDEKMAVVSSGLRDGERVVAQRHRGLIPGMKVRER